MALTERSILEHLKKYPFAPNTWEARWESTQAGIAEELGMEKSTPSRILNKLVEDGIVFSKLLHVKGRERRVKAYYLTEKGIVTINEMNEKRIGTLVPRYSNEKPDPVFFVGREEELKIFSNWITSPETRVLNVKGIAGVGKTMFVSRALDIHGIDSHIFWLKLKPWSSQNSILLQLFEYISTLKRKKLNEIIAWKKFSIDDVYFVLERELEDVKMVLVFDDYGRHCKKDVLELIEFLVSTRDKEKDARIILIGRDPPNFLDKTDPQLPIEKITIECLNKEETSALLEHENVDGEFHSDIHESTMGHPLALQLISKFGERGKKMTGAYLEEAIFSSITPDVRNMLEITSFLRKPVQIDVLLNISDTTGFPDLKEIGLKAMAETSLLYVAGGTYVLHDLLRSLVLSKMSNNKRKDLQHSIAEYFLSEQKTGGEILEALYHFGQAEESQKVHDLLMEYGDDLINRGSWSEVLESIDQVLDDHVERERADLLLKKGYILSIITGDMEKATEVYEQARDIYTKNNDTEGKINTYHGLGQCYCGRSLYQEGINNFDKAIALNARHNTEHMLPKLYQEIGTALVRMGRAEEGITELEKSIEYSKRSDPENILRATRKLGAMYIRKGEVSKGVTILRELVKELDPVKHSHQYLITLSLLGVGYSLLKDEEEALKWLDMTIEMSEEMGYIHILGSALSNMAEIFLESKNLVKAEEYAKRGVNICERAGNMGVLENAMLTHGAILTEKGNLEEGKRMFEEALTFNSEEPFIRGQTLEQYGRLLYKMGDKENAKKTLEKSKQTFIGIENKHFVEQVEETMRELGL